MGNLQIKNVPEPMHEELRRRAKQANMSMRDYLLGLIERDQALPSKADWLEKARALEPVDIGMSSAEAVARARAERDAELFGRS